MDRQVRYPNGKDISFDVFFTPSASSLRLPFEPCKNRLRLEWRTDSHSSFHILKVTTLSRCCPFSPLPKSLPSSASEIWIPSLPRRPRISETGLEHGAVQIRELRAPHAHPLWQIRAGAECHGPVRGNRRLRPQQAQERRGGCPVAPCPGAAAPCAPAPLPAHRADPRAPARHELSEECELCGGQWERLLPEGHPGVRPASAPAAPRRCAPLPRPRRAAVSPADAPRPHRPARPPRAPQAMEAKWSATRFTPFLVPPHHYPPPRRAHLPRLLPSTHPRDSTIREDQGGHSKKNKALGARALQVLDPEADVQPRAPDTEEYIVRERVPAADLEELAYSGALALPSAATALMGLRRLRRAGLL